MLFYWTRVCNQLGSLIPLTRLHRRWTSSAPGEVLAIRSPVMVTNDGRTVCYTLPLRSSFRVEAILISITILIQFLYTEQTILLIVYPLLLLFSTRLDLSHQWYWTFFMIFSSESLKRLSLLLANRINHLTFNTLFKLVYWNSTGYWALTLDNSYH